ncbi:hypothetical protein BJV82DRAFT_583937 [Fennellomyces sp. T-0311]|nr:hypothetical protein BJV82DRAFT_583937 [Fennellomyces sp. T-0311]
MPKGNSRRMHDSDDDIESVTPNRESKGRGKRRIKKSKVNIDWNVDGVAGFSKNPANLKVQEPVELEEGSDKAKDHSQKRAELAEGWNSVVSNISNDFTDLLAAGTPQQEAISPFIPSKEFNCSCEFCFGAESETVKECNFHFCKDIEPASVLLRHHLFPGSPKEPRIAFHLELLRAFEILRSISFISYEGFADFVSAFQRERI